MLLNITENIIAQVGIREKKKKRGVGGGEEKKERKHTKKNIKKERERVLEGSA